MSIRMCQSGMIVAVLAFAAGTANAQFYTEKEQQNLVTPMGASLSLGGGVMGFTDGDTNDFTNTGGIWEVRASIGTRMQLAAEAAYFGTAQGIDALGLDDDAILLGSGVEGALRFNMLMNSPVQPYLLAGIGWTHYDLVNEDFNNSSVENNDDLFHIPLAAGVAYRIGGFLVDARATVRPAFEEDLLDDTRTAENESTRLDSWAFSARLGYEF